MKDLADSRQTFPCEIQANVAGGWKWLESESCKERGWGSGGGGAGEKPTCDGFDGLTGNGLANEVILDQAGRLWRNLHRVLRPFGPGVDHLRLWIGVCWGHPSTSKIHSWSVEKLLFLKPFSSKVKTLELHWNPPVTLVLPRLIEPTLHHHHHLHLFLLWGLNNLN